MRQLSCLIAALLVSACVATPPTQPQVETIAQAGLGLSGPSAPHVAANWWTMFQDPQIDRLAAEVIAHNPSLQEALARIRAAQAALAASKAEDLPQIAVDASEQRTLFSKDYIIPPPYGGTYRWFGQLSASLSWNLDFWSKQADLIARARMSTQAAMLDAEAARLALTGAFAQAYVDLLLSYQNGDIADATVGERAEILAITQGRFDAGLEDASAVAQAKAILASAKADQLRFAAAREMDVHAIAALAGEGPAAYPSITRPNPRIDAALPLPQTLPADLLSRRPDILAARARIEAAMHARDAAHKEFYPDVNLAALAGFQAIGLSNLLTGNAFTMGVGPALHLPIFDAGKIRADYAGATAELDIAVADYNATVMNAIRQAADAMTEVKSLVGQRIQQQDALDNAQRAFMLAENRYRSGLATQIPMLTAESTLLQAREALAVVLAQSVSQRITLLLTLGGGFEPPQSETAMQGAAHQTARSQMDIANSERNFTHD